jgi:protein-serine/threonine kinase
MPIPDSSEDTTLNDGEADPPPSTLSSSTATSPTDSYGELPPSRAASQPASRSGSMSAGVGGEKLIIPKPVHVPSWLERRSSKSEVVPATPSRKASVHSDKGEGLSHKFNLKDLLANGPKLNRKSSTSSRRSDSDTGEGKARSTGGDSAVSLTQKYGVCQKVAIGKGATSVVRLAHKWDRTEEKLYAVKVSIIDCDLRYTSFTVFLPFSPRNSVNAVKMSRKKNM